MLMRGWKPKLVCWISFGQAYKISHFTLVDDCGQDKPWQYLLDCSLALDPTLGTNDLTSYYRMAKFKSPATSKASKGQWWKFELLTESLVWFPGKIIVFCGQWSDLQYLIWRLKHQNHNLISIILQSSTLRKYTILVKWHIYSKHLHSIK